MPILNPYVSLSPYPASVNPVRKIDIENCLKLKLCSLMPVRLRRHLLEGSTTVC